MKKTTKIIAFVAAAALFLTACQTQQAQIKGAPKGNPAVSKTQHLFIYGLAGQPAVIDAAAVCGGADKVQAIETQMSFIDGLLTGITYSLYTPRTVKVYCEK